ncbi:MAG: hypothetical protein AMJ54_13245 [Deltaproteobacteria bacterium SG8_13]|nr:MAG: hypothetical protein AMJ54_13245 [Deltaproteobacteria bacterium SG8_13]
MNPPENRLTVSQAAALCGVNRNTIGAWIRSGKIQADKVGRNYSIPVEELVFFLHSTGQKIPAELGGDRLAGPSFRTIRHCWHYFQDKVNQKTCEQCTVFQNRLEVCFTGKDSHALVCNGRCHQCDYYRDVFYPRIQFIQQIAYPAAVYKDLCLWAGNPKWSELTGVPEAELVGLGIEKICHPASLGEFISNDKKRTLGNPQAPRIEDLYIRHAQLGRMRVRIAVYPLSEPSGTWLLLGEAHTGKSLNDQPGIKR